MLGEVFLVLVLEALLGVVIWLVANYGWNNVVREELRVKSERAWTYFLAAALSIINAILIVHLLNGYSDPVAVSTEAPTSVELTILQCEQAAREYEPRSSADQRPDFGFSNQVMSPEELVVGETYVRCNLQHGSAVAYVLTSEPYGYEIGAFRDLRVDVWHLEENFFSHLFLADMSVIPYQSGKWNGVNVILYLP